MKKIEELFGNDFERTFLAKIHRIASHTLLANIPSLIFRLKQFFKTKNSLLPANLWLIEHMHEFIQQRYIDMNKKKSIDDLLQIMIDALHSDKVRIVLFYLFYLNDFHRINYYQMNY